MTERQTPYNDFADFLAALGRAEYAVSNTDQSDEMDTGPQTREGLARLLAMTASLSRFYEQLSVSAARSFALAVDREICGATDEDVLSLNPDLVSGIYKGMIDEHLDMLGISVADND